MGSALRLGALSSRRGRPSNLEEPTIVALRIATLLCCAPALGACVGPSATGPHAAAIEPLAISNSALPPSYEPGRLLRPGLGAGGGVDPAAQLDKSARDRAAWAPLRAGPIGRSAIVDTRNAGRSGSRDAAGLNGMASMPPAGNDDRRGVPTPIRGRDSTMDRLERAGQRTAKPICGDC